jgi:hypothetical protein
VAFCPIFPLLVGSVLEVKRQDCQLHVILLFWEKKFSCQVQLLTFTLIELVQKHFFVEEINKLGCQMPRLFLN